MHSSTTPTLPDFHLHLFGIYRREKGGEYADLQSLWRCIAIVDVDGCSEEPIVIVLTTKKEHSIDTIRWLAALMR